MMAHSVNYLSVLLAAVAAWIFGGVYYTALGKYWMAAQGKTMEQCQAEYAGKSGAAASRHSGVAGAPLAAYDNSSSWGRACFGGPPRT